MSTVSTSWDRRIRRAERLAAENGPASSLLTFYAQLLRHQEMLYESFRSRPLTGSIERDVSRIAASGSAMVRAVVEHGPEQLVAEARTILESDPSACEQRLLTYWQTRSDREFFAKALLQPYGQWLADAGVTRAGGNSAMDNRCPRCGGAPQLSILEAGAAASADGSTRQLLCATCLTQWPFRRVVCPSCGEEDERKLAYFQSPESNHVRVDACDSCWRYLKSIDLGQLGVAVPLVDEVAAAPLDVWAREHGYEKMELNLVGL